MAKKVKKNIKPAKKAIKPVSKKAEKTGKTAGSAVKKQAEKQAVKSAKKSISVKSKAPVKVKPAKKIPVPVKKAQKPVAKPAPVTEKPVVKKNATLVPPVKAAPAKVPATGKRSSSQQQVKKRVIKEIIPLKMDIPEAKELAAKKTKPEPKGKYQLEYVVHASGNILYEFLSTPSGLSEWFADDVNIRAGVYTFFWDGSQQAARLVNYKEPQFIRFQWVDKNDGSYFEFRIEKDELTGDISLIVTDFVADPAEQQTSKLLWDSQVNKLLQVIGSY